MHISDQQQRNLMADLGLTATIATPNLLYAWLATRGFTGSALSERLVKYAVAHNMSITQVMKNIGRWGPELAVNGTFAAGSSGWTLEGEDVTHILTFDGSTLRYQSDTTTPVLTARQQCLVIGRQYEITAVTSAYTSGILKTDCFNNSAHISTGVGTMRTVGVATSEAFTILRASASVDITLDSVSIRELVV